ncbi:hypothetical protein Q8F97_27565, partial [Klebsiella pneumoniae]|uniref:hypothetical protein n=1 Tax=Klebsiella pneumoniae TaxID=573 RepID=UPI0027314D09
YFTSGAAWPAAANSFAICVLISSAPEVKYIFELNPAHQLVKRAADTQDDAQFGEWVELLLDQALLAE